MPTIVEHVEQVRDHLVEVTDRIRAIGAALVTGYGEIVDSLDGEEAARLETPARQQLGDVAGALAPARLREIWRPKLRDLWRDLYEGAPPADSGLLLAGIRQAMADDPFHIPARGLTYGAPAAVGTPAGNGVIRRLTVDKDGYDLPATPELLSFEVERDQTSGAQKFAEVFRVRGRPPRSSQSFNRLDWTGSGLDVELTALHDQSSALLDNPSFERHDQTADDTSPGSTTAIGGWEISGGDASGIKLRSASTHVYRPPFQHPDGLDHWSVEFAANRKLTQRLRAANLRAQFPRDVPVFLRVAVARKASATGTLKLRLGTVTIELDVSTLTNDVWHHLVLSTDELAYYDNFSADDLEAEIEMTSLATGTVVVDDTVLSLWTRIGGSFWVADGGDDAWLAGDRYEAATTEPNPRSLLAYELWRAFGDEGWLPNVADATEVEASGARTLEFSDEGSGAGNEDTVTASSGSFLNDGYRPGMVLVVTGTSNNGSYRILSVTALVITLRADEELTNEGPLSSTAKLNARPLITDPAA